MEFPCKLEHVIFIVNVFQEVFITQFIDIFDANQPASSIALINVLNATVSSFKLALRLARTTLSAAWCFPGNNSMYNTTSIAEEMQRKV